MHTPATRRFEISCTRQRSSRGFTLMELLVSIAVLALLAAISIQSFANYAHKQKYLSVVDQVRNNLELTRVKTGASYKDTVYGVYVGTSTVEFFQGPVPVAGGSENTIIDLTAHAITATSSFSNSEWYVTFARVTGEASATGTISIQDERSGASNIFTIYRSGLVE